MSYQWENYINIGSEISSQKRERVSGALNWLEEYCPKFMEVLWDLDRRQKAEGIARLDGKVEIFEGRVTQYEAGDRFSLEFGYDFYLAQDGRLYEFSLNETILHELTHGSQQLYREFDHQIDDTAYMELVSQSSGALKNYLLSKGVPEIDYKSPDHEAVLKMRSRRTPSVSDYNLVYRGLETDDKDFDFKILNDPEYQRLLKAHVDNMKEHRHNYPAEDNAMDHTDELRAIVGKPPRGHYAHSSAMIPDEMDYTKVGEMSVVAYTDSPDLLRKAGQPSWEGPKIRELGPINTGEITRHFQRVTESVSNLNDQWNQEFNQDRMNITQDEWRFIARARAEFFEERKISELTTEDRQIYDTLMDGLMSGFNVSPGNDTLTAEQQQGISEEMRKSLFVSGQTSKM